MWELFTHLYCMDTLPARPGHTVMEGNSDNTTGQTPQGAVVFDGMLLPPFPPLMKDAKKRFEDIKNLPCRKDDVILAIYPKSGNYF